MGVKHNYTGNETVQTTQGSFAYHRHFYDPQILAKSRNKLSIALYILISALRVSMWQNINVSDPSDYGGSMTEPGFNPYHYEMEMYTLQCLYWDPNTTSFRSDGCQVGSLSMFLVFFRTKDYLFRILKTKIMWFSAFYYCIWNIALSVSFEVTAISEMTIIFSVIDIVWTNLSGFSGIQPQLDCLPVWSSHGFCIRFCGPDEQHQSGWISIWKVERESRGFLSYAVLHVSLSCTADLGQKERSDWWILGLWSFILVGRIFC